MTAASPRLIGPDLLRGLALFAMASFHLTWDLDYFRWINPNLVESTAFKLYGHVIASTFLGLVGVSLVLAWRRPNPWPAFWRRLAVLAFAASAVTLATHFFLPDGFIFFGILHCIVLASLAALPFLSLPLPLTALAMALAFGLPQIIASPALDGPLAWWLGLGTVLPESFDIRPFFPWFGMVLAGVLAARLGIADRLVVAPNQSALQRWLGFAGRHSLGLYLVHQPVLFGAMFAIAALTGQSNMPAPPSFQRQCVAQCVVQGKSVGFCTAGCTCFENRIRHESLWNKVQSGTLTPSEHAQINELARQCVRNDTNQP